MIKMKENMLKQIIINTINGEEHLGENVKNLCVDYIDKLQNNWNELKKYIDNQLCNIQFEYEERFLDRNEFNNKLGVLNRLKSKMQELEQGKDE